MRLRSLLLLFALGCTNDPAPRSSTAAARNKAPEVREEKTPPCSSEWQDLETGLRYRSLGCSESNPIELHVVEIDPVSWSIEAVTGEPATSDSVARAHDAAFAINANFFDETKRPLGLVVSDGAVKNPLHPVSWQSVFFLDQQSAVGIQPQEQWSEIAPSVEAAVQCGPRLVINGVRNQVERGEPSLRSGVCITPEKKVRFFATPQDRYFDVHEMVEFAADPNALGCENAMLFDGGPSAQIFLDSSVDLKIEGDLVPAHLIAKRAQ